MQQIYIRHIKYKYGLFCFNRTGIGTFLKFVFSAFLTTQLEYSYIVLSCVKLKIHSFRIYNPFWNIYPQTILKITKKDDL